MWHQPWGQINVLNQTNTVIVSASLNLGWEIRFPFTHILFLIWLSDISFSKIHIWWPFFVAGKMMAGKGGKVSPQSWKFFCREVLSEAGRLLWGCGVCVCVSEGGGGAHWWGLTPWHLMCRIWFPHLLPVKGRSQCSLILNYLQYWGRWINRGWCFIYWVHNIMC